MELGTDWSYYRAAAMIFSSVGAAYGTAKVCSGISCSGYE